MQLSRLTEGRTPFIMNVTVFSATAIVEGALLVTGATTTAQGATVTVATTTASNADFIGVTQVGSLLASVSKENAAPNSHAFNMPSSGFPVTGSAATTAPTAKPLSYLPLCVNTDALYFGLYGNTTATGTTGDTVGTFTASTGTVVTRGSTGLDILGGWLFSLGGVNTAGNTPTFSGSLRYISNQTSTTDLVLLTAMNVSTDSHMIWVDRTWKKAGQLNSTANALRSASAASGTGLKQNGARMLAVENYMISDHAPLHPLRPWVDDGLNGLTNVRLYGEFVFTSPFLQELA